MIDFREDDLAESLEPRDEKVRDDSSDSVFQKFSYTS